MEESTPQGFRNQKIGLWILTGTVLSPANSAWTIAGGGSTGALLLDQTTPQSVINGRPSFTGGLRVGSGAEKFGATFEIDDDSGMPFAISMNVNYDLMARWWHTWAVDNLGTNSWMDYRCNQTTGDIELWSGDGTTPFNINAGSVTIYSSQGYPATLSVLGGITTTVIRDNNTGVKAIDITSPYRIFYDASEVPMLTFGSGGVAPTWNNFAGNGDKYLGIDNGGQMTLNDPPTITETDPVFSNWLGTLHEMQFLDSTLTLPGTFGFEGMFYLDYGIRPTQDLYYDSGRADMRWANVYGGNFIGDGSQLTNLPAPSGIFLLDQTTPQQVINGTPNFQSGISFDSGASFPTPVTYIYSADGISVDVWANSTPVMRIEGSNGNVLIGTQTDDTTHKLQVWGTAFRFGEAADMFRMESTGDVIIGSIADDGLNLLQVAGGGIFDNLYLRAGGVLTLDTATIDFSGGQFNIAGGDIYATGIVLNSYGANFSDQLVLQNQTTDGFAVYTGTTGTFGYQAYGYTGDLNDSTYTKIADVVNGLITQVYY